MLTFQAERLTPAHLKAAGARENTPVVGMEKRREFWRYMAESRDELDVMAARQDILEGGEELIVRRAHLRRWGRRLQDVERAAQLVPHADHVHAELVRRAVRAQRAELGAEAPGEVVQHLLVLLG